MKRCISIFLGISLCFSLAACTGKEKTPDVTSTSAAEATTEAVPVPLTEAEEYSKDFTDENGRTVYTVRALLPKITGNVPEDIAKDINRSLCGIFEDACETAEINIDNAAEFMDSQNSGTPWARSFDYEVNLCSDKYFSITVRDYFTMFGSEELEPAMRGYTFDVARGRLCTLTDFFYENYSYDSVRQIIVDEFICKDVSKIYFEGKELTDEMRTAINEVFDTENFYLTDSGIGFYFSENAVNPQYFGTFVAHYEWQEIAVILKRP